MKLTIDIGGTKVILTSEQAEDLVALLSQADFLKAEWVSKTSSYTYSIEEYRVRERLAFAPMTADEYEALRFIDKVAEA